MMDVGMVVGARVGAIFAGGLIIGYVWGSGSRISGDQRSRGAPNSPPRPLP